MKLFNDDLNCKLFEEDAETMKRISYYFEELVAGIGTMEKLAPSRQRT